MGRRPEISKQLLVGGCFVFETRLNTLLVVLGLFGACLHPVPELQPGTGTSRVHQAQAERGKCPVCWSWWSGAARGELCQEGAQHWVFLMWSPLSSQDSARAGTATQDRRARPWGSSSAPPGTTEIHREGAQVLLWFGQDFPCQIRDYLGKGAAGPCPDIPIPMLFGKRDFLSGAASQFIASIHQCPPSSLG